MNTAIEIVGYGGLVPGVIAIAVYRLALWLPAGAGPRFSAALAFASAFFVGYVLMPDWAELAPTRHWHWLPYLAGMAAILGAVGLADGVSIVDRWLLQGLLAIVGGWLLVPDWASLQPSRAVYVPLLSVYFVVLCAALDGLPERLPGRLFPVLLGVVSVASTISIAFFVSVKLGQVAGIATAGLLGCGVANLTRPTSVASRGVIPGYVVIVGGLAFVAGIEPEPPLLALLLIPAAPLALWSCAWGPLSRTRGYAGAASQFAAVLLPAAVGFVAVFLTQGGADRGY